jgi:hypothetical protein
MVTLITTLFGEVLGPARAAVVGVLRSVVSRALHRLASGIAFIADGLESPKKEKAACCCPVAN